LSKGCLAIQQELADNLLLLLLCLWLLCLVLLQLNELKTELAALRVAKVTGGAPNKLSKM
jgi:hypothetical protein